jgi:type IV secretory pathway protease TraF
MPPQKDSSGRPLSVWRYCRILGKDELFVFSTRIPNRLDSRCYGPTLRQEIDAVRKPMLSW